MNQHNYHWKRFWVARDGNINLSDGGYLWNPDSDFGRIYNPDALPFETIAKVPCLVLLGEPGIGKSNEINKQWGLTSQRSKETGEVALRFDLRVYQTDVRLCQEIFEANEDFQNWRNGGSNLHLFLDSLDEGLLEIRTLANLLNSELRKYPVERLYLRIACRTAEWPSILENGLMELWGKNSVGVYELAPLRRIDVIEAVKVKNIESELFLEEVERKGAVPFAIKPITLAFLINTYSRNRQLPSTKTELFIEGCRLLCEETNESRIDSNRIGCLTAKQRLSVAARIAAVTVFCSKNLVYTATDMGDVTDKEVTIQRLSGGKESANGNEFEINEATIREVLSTGLFSARGQNCLGWSHQSYPEFLAAWYVLQHGMSLAQIKNLIIHPADPEGKLVPQLNETIAWLAGMLPEVFRLVIELDPETLLRSDLTAIADDDRKALVETLLALYEEEKSLANDWDLIIGYKKLAHPGLAKQLRSQIIERSKSHIARRVAIDIAEACGLMELQKDMVDIALDTQETQPIRVCAAYAINRFGSDEFKAKLEPLALGKAGDDPDDELKGCGLRAVWPAHMSADELFSILTPPQREHLIGVYKIFLSEHLMQHFQPAHLPAALAWVESRGHRSVLPYPFHELIDEFMFLGWKYIDSENILEAYAKAILSRWKNFDEIVNGRRAAEFNVEVTNNDTKRRRVIETIVSLLGESDEGSEEWLHFRLPMPLNNDIFWMIQQLYECESKNSQRVWARLISWTFDKENPEQIDAILTAAQENSILVEAIPWLFKVVDLNSPEAESMKRIHSREKSYLERRESKPKLNPPKVRLAEILTDCEAGNSNAWLNLNLELTRESEDSDYGDWFRSPIESLPGWKSASANDKQRILEAGRKYVLNQQPSMEELITNRSISFPVFAGYSALKLLIQFDQPFVLGLLSDVWKQWTPIILFYAPDDDKHRSLPLNLFNLAYKCAPDVFIDTLMLFIDRENQDEGDIHVVRKLKSCWDVRLEKALLDKAKDQQLKPKCMASLLKVLLDNNVDEARAIAISSVTVPIPAEGIARSKAVVAASVIMTYFIDTGWDVVWPAIQKDEHFGREVVTQIVWGLEERRVSLLYRLSEDHLGELFIWLARQFPFEEDITKRDEVASWRNSILQHLKQRGTLKGCETLQQIAQELPELDWLKWTLKEAHDIARRNTWIPPDPSHFLRLASDQRARLINNGDQLLDLLLDSLRRLEAKLQGETPAAIDLWNESKKNAFKPKDENRLSDYVKRHLEDDIKQRGIVVHREVEIRRGTGSNQGERTDIYVDAFVRIPNGKAIDFISAIIEVKGCWHKELYSAMKTQLVDRYLKDNQCRHGLYLVGWFNCDQWDKKHYRKNKLLKSQNQSYKRKWRFKPRNCPKTD